MSQPAPDQAPIKRAKTGSLEGIDVQEAARNAAALSPQEKARRRQIGWTLALAVLGTVAVIVMRLPDPLEGPRPPAALMGALPAVIQAYQGLARGGGKVPTPEQVAAAVQKKSHKKVTIVGAGKKAPNAVRLAGTPDKPALELLDEKGEIAIYGDMPVVIPVEVN